MKRLLMVAFVVLWLPMVQQYYQIPPRLTMSTEQAAQLLADGEAHLIWQVLDDGSVWLEWNGTAYKACLYPSMGCS